MKTRVYIRFLLVLVLLLGIGVQVQAAFAANRPVVRAVLFYSPTCPHCHEVINNVLPPLAEQYGDQLQIVGIDVSQDQGQSLYQAAVTRFNIPQERLGVPTLIVGEVVLVGSGEIPAVFPDLIGKMLDSGGTDWPDVPGLGEALSAEIDPADAEKPAEQQSAEDQSDRSTFINNFMRDPVANSIAVAVLLGMIASVVVVGASYLNGKQNSLLLWPKWVLPVLAMIGLGVALYLSYIEITRSEAVCGPVGDCGSVQDSPYAYLFGVIPVGLMGAAGYVAIIGAWLLREYGPERWHKLAVLAIWGMAWFGVLFSIYLTFLEPFVIGATCMWCITSAVLMTLILLASTESAKQALNVAEEDFYDDEEDDEDSEDEDNNEE